MTKNKYQRILLKISGESLSNGKDLFDGGKLNLLVKQVKTLCDSQVQIAIVVGGGNIWRGKEAINLNIARNDADYMGMCATIINALALKNVFENHSIPAKAYSALAIEGVIEKFDYKKINHKMNKNKVVILAAGTGSPFFTTDTTAALRACELKCEAIFMGKNNVDGIYEQDPAINKNAKRYETITFKEALDKNLKVMDATALTLCQENKLEIYVYNSNRDNALVNAFLGIDKNLFSKISG